MMYEQKRVSIVGRIVWFIVSVLVLIALVWLVLWLLFWRNQDVSDVVETTKTTGSSVIQKVEDEAGADISVNKQADESASPAVSTGSTAPSSATTTPTTSEQDEESSTSATSGQTSATSTQTPSAELAKTGAGSLVVPVIAVATFATVGYHLRQRKIYAE